MPNICLTIGTHTPATKILDALTTLEGLAAWWTQGTTGNPAEGGTITFAFGSKNAVDMRVTRLTADQVHWECRKGPGDWIGTPLEFWIEQDNDVQTLKFRHGGWEGENDFFYHCATQWATFLLSLRDYLETGKGRPFPNDLYISP
jgi:hypothetical protein